MALRIILKSWESTEIWRCGVDSSDSGLVPVNVFFEHNNLCYNDSLRAGRSGDRIPMGSDIFRTCPAQPWGPPWLLYNGYRVIPRGVKRPGLGLNHAPSSSVEVKERVELYLYSPSGSSWQVLEWTLSSVSLLYLNVGEFFVVLATFGFKRELCCMKLATLVGM